ncbi:KEOPS complex subunit Pcc1 [Archaeoglobus sp.]
MLCHARLEIESKDAERVVKALKPDDPEWCRCYADDGKIVIIVEVEKVGTLLSALDDYLMNIKMCEKILETL